MTQPVGSHRLLAIRLADLKQDVEKVRGVVDLAARRHRLVRALRDRITLWGDHSAIAPLNRVKGDLERLRDLLPELDADLPAIIAENGVQLDRAVADLGEALTRLKEAQATLGSVGVPVELDQTTQAELGNNLSTCESIGWEIDALIKKLATADDVRALWREYDRLSTERCEPLFVDYVDFLGGLTMRDNRLDERIGELAETFVQELGALRLAIPARGPVGPGVLPVLMKLGFPEWTLWDVPLGAHEVTLRQATTSPISDWLKTVELGSRGEAHRAVLFADISAAYAVGPAYACATVLLRLRPDRSGTSDAPSDVERAYVIFQLLRRVQAEGQLAVDVELACDYWASAATELGGTDRPADHQALDEFVAAAHTVLNNRPGYGPDRREAAVNRFKSVLNPEGENATYAGTVVDLLNAVWSAWLRKEGTPNEIERRALCAWAGPGHTGGGSPGSRAGLSLSGRRLRDRP